MSRLFARHKGRHCRRHSVTGWSGLAGLIPPQRREEPFVRARTPLVLTPLAADELIPFADYRHPYDSPKDAA